MTKEIQLTQGKVAIVDDCDYEYLSQFRWHAQQTHNIWYAVRSLPRVDGKQKAELMHRIILDAPKGSDVDHIDGDGLNNQRGNLRVASRAQNLWNRRRSARNTSGYTGVSWDKGIGKWTAYISEGGKTRHLGCFATAEEAAVARNSVAIQIYGEFARLNEI